MEARDVFSRSTPSMTKRAGSMNNYENIIIKIDENNVTAICPECGVNEYWEHVMLCKNNKENRRY